MNKIGEYIPSGKAFCENITSFDRFELSRFAHEKSNPTMEQARELCTALGKDIFDVYDRADLDYSVLHQKAERVRTSTKQNPRITHRVSPEDFAKIQQAVTACGYGSIADWLATCAYRLLREAEHKKKPACADTQTSLAKG